MKAPQEKKLMPASRRKLEREAIRNRNNLINETIAMKAAPVIIANGTMNDMFPVFDGEYRKVDFDKKARDKFLREFKPLGVDVTYDRSDKVYVFRKM